MTVILYKSKESRPIFKSLAASWTPQLWWEEAPLAAGLPGVVNIYCWELLWLHLLADLAPCLLCHLTVMICILYGEEPSQSQWFRSDAGLSCHCNVWQRALHWYCAVSPSSPALKETVLLQHLIAVNLSLSLMEAVQALVGSTKAKIAMFRWTHCKHRLGGHIFL